MPVHQFDRWVRKHVRRIRLGQFLRFGAEFGAIFLCLFGVAVLFSKLAVPDFWPHVLWLSFGLIPVALMAWWFVVRQPWDRAESVARLDRSLDAGGLLMALSECPDSEWQQRLPQLDQKWREAIPQIRPRRFAMNLALPLTFAVAACFVPVRDASRSLFARNTPAGNEARKLEELLEKLKETTTLEPEEREQIKQELAKLSDEVRNKPFDSRKWETLDALRERMHERIDSASNLTLQSQDAVQGLQEEIDDHVLKLSPQEQAQLSEFLKKLQTGGELEKALKDAPPEIRASLQQLLNGSESKPTGAESPGSKSGEMKKPGDQNGKPESRKELTAEQQASLEQLLKHLQEKAAKDPAVREAAEKLAQSLQKSASERAASQQRQQTLKKNLGQTLQKLSKRGAFDKASPEVRSKLEKLMKRGESLDLPSQAKERQEALNDLQEFLAQENSKFAQLQAEAGRNSGEAEGEGTGLSGQKTGQSRAGEVRRGGSTPGRGGNGDGPGAADMTWGDESPKMLQRFKEIALPEGTSTDPKDDVMRITKTAPTEKPTTSAFRGEQRKMDPSTGSVTVNHKLSPRHRGVVRRFFEDSKAALPVPK